MASLASTLRRVAHIENRLDGGATVENFQFVA